MALTANAHTEIPVNATVIEKAITKLKDKHKEAAKTEKAENTEEDHAIHVAFVTSFDVTATKII